MTGPNLDIRESFRLAGRHYQAGRVTQAETLCRQMLEAQPANPDVLHLLGVISLQHGKNEEAIDLIGKAVRSNPKSAQCFNHLGAAHYRLDRLDEAVKCCRHAIELSPRYADAHNNLGATLHKQGRWEEAAACYRRALNIKANFADAHHNLGKSRFAQGRLDEAIACFRRAVELNPRFAAAYHHLGRALRLKENVPESIESQRRALEIEPDYVPALVELGVALQARACPGEAVESFRKALAVDPSCAAAHTNLGTALTALGRHPEAAEHSRQAVELEPGNAEAHNNLGNVLIACGRIEEAIACYRKAIELSPTLTKAYANLSRSKQYTHANEPEVQCAEALLAGEKLPPRTRLPLHFALGKIYDDCREWDRAFAHFQEANRLENVHFDERKVDRYVRDLIETFDEGLLAGADAGGRESELPVFIVGMPRSATTLIEQVLDSHPDVCGAGELTDIEKITVAVPDGLQSDRPYPGWIARLDRPTARRLAEEYLARLRKLGGRAVRVTDKMPGNYLHLGLIALLMPRARIIHCRRHPLDVCLSCYFQNFRNRLAFAYDLHDLGVYYRLYEKLMDHWRAVLPRPMLEVDYEAFVENQEAVSRRLIEFCGLNWHPDCLNFQANPRVVQTASRWQVRQPVYAHAVGRWKHYEKFLGPLKEALGWPP